MEVGFCSDTSHTIKYRQKQAQHARLLTILRTQGYRVDLTVVSLGTTGTIPATTYPDLKCLGLDHDAIMTLLRKLHLLTIQHFGHILFERRRRENLIEPG